MPTVYGFEKPTAQKLVRIARAVDRRGAPPQAPPRRGIAGGGGCTPTQYVTALQVTTSAIQYKVFDVETCTESAWQTLISLTSDC